MLKSDGGDSVDGSFADDDPPEGLASVVEAAEPTMMG
jgi:hypothetical protein